MCGKEQDLKVKQRESVNFMTYGHFHVSKSFGRCCS